MTITSSPPAVHEMVYTSRYITSGQTNSAVQLRRGCQPAMSRASQLASAARSRRSVLDRRALHLQAPAYSQACDSTDGAFMLSAPPYPARSIGVADHVVCVDVAGMDPCRRRCLPENSFADGLYASSRLRDTRTEIDAISSCFRFILLLPLFFLERRASPTYHFHGIVKLLNHRTTSKPADETLAVAGLLDLAKLLAVGDTEGRLQTLLLQVRTPSTSIILGGGARMQRSLGVTDAQGVLAARLDYATCAPDGLAADAGFSVNSFPNRTPCGADVEHDKNVPVCVDPFAFCSPHPWLRTARFQRRNHPSQSRTSDSQ